MTPFVGRQLEVAALRSRLAETVAGDPQVVLIDGPPGIGKTALVEHFLAGVEQPLVVLRSGGEETEALLANGVVEQVARSAGAAGAGLLAALGAEPVPDPVSVGTRILDMVDRIEGEMPVVLVVDDAHWADLPSMMALVFALRRLVAEPLLALFTARAEEVAALPESLHRLVNGHRGSTLRVRGLDEEDLLELARGLGVHELGLTAAQRLRYGTQGNPLHAKALIEEFPPDRWVPLQQPLPSPRSFRVLVQDRFGRCSAAARALVEGAAALGPHCPLPLAAAVAGLDAPLPALDEAVRAELLVTDESRTPWVLSFPHPLVRAAVHDTMGPARRHALHTAAAGVVTDEAEILRHRVAAAAEPDDELAADLTRFADAEAERQAWQSASAHLVDASRLSTAPAEAQRRVLQAVEWTLLRGDAASASPFAQEIATFPPGPLRDAVLGSLATAADDPAAAEHLLATAWSAADGADSETLAAVATAIAIHHYGRLDAAGTVEWCERALAHTAPGTATRAVTQTYLLHGLGYAGRAEAAAAVGKAADEDAGADELWLNPRSARGVLRLVDDDLDGARADLESVAATATRLGILNTTAFGLAYLARAEWTAGEWDGAAVHAERAVAVNLQSDFGFMQAAVVGIAVLVPAARGDWATATAHVRAMGEGTAGYERSVVARGMARARIGEAQGDAAAVVAALEPVCGFRYRDAVDEPGFWPWQDLYADALVGVGRAAEADAFLVPHEHRAAERGRRSSIARLARSRGRVEAALGRIDAAEAAFAHALDVSDGLRAPFERARIELAAGAVLRRAGRRRRAAELLAAAEDRFTALGALPYAQRCAKELAGSGLHPARRATRDRTELTSQELVVARLAAAGRSNREIADELVVSIKTIEYHLRNVFQKLGVTGRRQLADSGID
ncbi:helix-turn-helix transcriptional regulator [Pseudonocardia sp. CA-107938]|uniref:helix-turn-helix transcriptional regulator n=1 Tax=Pseudonocardia sp. CA-107938 TaxID=3240021 RepID=UPI003D9280FC